MQCPDCKSEKLTSELIPVNVVSSLAFRVECRDCRHQWEESKVIIPELSTETRIHWANVEDPFDRQAREFREIQKGLDEGKCPKCGDPLVHRERIPAESPAYVQYDAVCRKCKWSYFSAVSYKDWAEEKQKKAVAEGL